MNVERGSGRGPETFTYVAIALILALAALIVYRDHPLVVFTSDRPNQELFATTDLQPGTSTSSGITLGNGGLIPFDYSLKVEDPAGRPPPGAFRLRIVRESDGRVLYDGPLSGATGRLDTLVPGQSVKLALRLSLPAEAAKQNLNVYFKWHAHATFMVGWWAPLAVAATLLAGLALSAFFYVTFGAFGRRKPVEPNWVAS